MPQRTTKLLSHRCQASARLDLDFRGFLSAFSLFQVQLIISKHMLPWFGGSATTIGCPLVVAGQQRSHFDDGIWKLAHCADKGFH